MITKRHIYEPLERLESAVARLYELAAESQDKWASYKIHEIVQRDLSEAREKLEYVMEIAD